MSDTFPEAWQAGFVSEIGSTTQHIPYLGADSPLRITRGNLPIGTVVGEAPYTGTVAAPYLKVEWSLPADLAGTFTFSGKIRILRRPLQFPRDATDASASPPRAIELFAYDYTIDGDWGGAIPIGEYGDRFTLLDQPAVPGVTWYYTIFFENSVSGLYAFSSVYGLGRNYAYKQETSSMHGDIIYKLLPRVWRLLDALEGEAATNSLFQTIGLVFDAIKEDIDKLKESRYDADTTDFANLAEIDAITGWPTNFELGELKRRKETKQAVALWKARGTEAAIRLAIQTVTGWSVELTDGWPWVLVAGGSPVLDAGIPPAGWNAGTDGVWADLVNAMPINGAVQASTTMAAATGTPQDKKVYVPSAPSNGPNGWWQNPFGVLVTLNEVSAVSGPLVSSAILKAVRLAPVFIAHHAAYTLMIIPLSVSESVTVPGDTYSDLVQMQAPAEGVPAPQNGFVDFVPNHFWLRAGSFGFSPDYGGVAGNPLATTPHATAWSPYEFEESFLSPLFKTRYELPDNLALWLKAEDTSEIEGDPVGDAGELVSQVGPDALQATGSKQPIVIRGSGSRKALRFLSSASQHLIASAVGLSGSTNFTVLIVVRLNDAVTASQVILEWGSPSYVGATLGLVVMNDGGYIEVGVSGDVGTSHRRTTQKYAGGWLCIQIEVDSALSATDEVLQVKINGLEVPYTAPFSSENTSSASDESVHIACRDGVSNFCEMDLQELLILKDGSDFAPIFSAYLMSLYEITAGQQFLDSLATAYGPASMFKPTALRRLSDASKVEEWPSCEGESAVEGTPSRQPYYYEEGWTKGGPVVQFDDSDDGLTAPFDASGGSTLFGIALVHSENASPLKSRAAVEYGRYYVGAGGASLFFHPTSDRVFVGCGVAGAYQDASFNGRGSGTHVFAWTVDSSLASPNQIRLWIDGVEETPTSTGGTGMVGNFPAGDLSIGGRPDGAGAYERSFNGGVRFVFQSVGIPTDSEIVLASKQVALDGRMA